MRVPAADFPAKKPTAMFGKLGSRPGGGNLGIREFWARGRASFFTPGEK